jgi:hypothetical protein
MTGRQRAALEIARDDGYVTAYDADSGALDTCLDNRWLGLFVDFDGEVVGYQLTAKGAAALAAECDGEA